MTDTENAKHLDGHRRALVYQFGPWATDQAAAWRMADQVIAAGWRPPTTPAPPHPLEPAPEHRGPRGDDAVRGPDGVRGPTALPPGDLR